MIFPDLVQLYQFQYLFRLFYFFLPLPRLLFNLIVAFMPKLLEIYMNMKPAGSLPGCDDALKIIKGISGTIIGCRRQLSYPIFVVQHFYSADYTDCADYADCADGHAANYRDCPVCAKYAHHG